MNSQCFYPGGSADSLREDPKQRQRLREKLGLLPFLAEREVLCLGPHGIHCEVYSQDPSAPVILFLPGIGTYSELYAEVLAGIARQGFTLVGIDVRGHGYSGGARGEYRVDQVVDDLRQVLDCLQQRFTGPVGIYGYSIGGLLALALAEQEPRIQSLLCGTLLVTEMPPDVLHSFGWAWTWSSALFFPGLSLPMRTFIDYDRLLAGHPASEEINKDPRVVFDYPLGTLSSLFTHRCGALQQAYPFQACILQGDRDEVLGLEYTERVIAAMTHPFQLRVLPGEGHMIPWDNPPLLIQAVADWFHQTLPQADTSLASA